MSRIVISFSIYGNVKKYVGGLLENCKTINNVYPHFWIYVYVGDDFDRDIFGNKFNDIKNLKFIDTGLSGHTNMLCRFLSIDYDEVAITFSRDCDSRINNRDQFCINKFIESDKQFQIIRDNASHNIPILGGMWGIKKGCINDKIKDMLNLFLQGKSINHGDDQIFLSKLLYPKVIHISLVFDNFFKFQNEHPIPIDIPDVVENGIRDHVGKPFMPVNLNEPYGLHGEWYAI